MRGRIALPKHFVRIRAKRLHDFAELLECVRVFASLFDVSTAPVPKTTPQQELQNELR